MKRFFLILIMIAGCKEEYNPPLKNADYNFLVVEGNILAGNDSTFVHLTRTVAVSDTSNVQPELNATVKVESENGESYLLQEHGNGLYIAPPLNISLSENYRLHIITSNGREYASDYVPVKQTPPIDSVSWKLDNNNGVAIYTTTHDATGSSQYYRWEFTETWEHRSRDSSVLIYEASLRNLRYRIPSEQLYRCWNINTSGEILIASTAGLSADLVYEKPITNIPYASQKISKIYSVLVKQYALTKGAFEYWDNLKKNTEELGSIFDPQPFADYGNMHSITDASEPVLGYISACSVAQQRIYITWSQVQWPYSFPECKDTIVSPDNIDTVFSGFDFLPVGYVYPPPGAVFGTSQECADCRLTGGGSTVRPSYMP
ncbi:MAG TPA: DUF4249 domain-containing protein [Parafilimonas sp.]|nr:DUF4249 domain-containing protein [Parafilimonas sp.]